MIQIVPGSRPYADLTEASGCAWTIGGEKKLDPRDDFAIEDEVNSPNVTPQEQLVTQMMIPIV